MTNQIYYEALKYCDDKLLSMRQDEHGHQLFCYTKGCFFGDNTWDDMTKSHRGQLYYDSKQVNRPFKKIFNVDEVEETNHDLVCQRMLDEPYEILDKANGHLFIVSIFEDDEGISHLVYSTKGSLPNPENDLLNDDIKIFDALYGNKINDIRASFANITLMFEAIVSHDKHSLYDLQVKQYGHENCFVLLGAATKVDITKEDQDRPHSDHNQTTLRQDPWVELNWDTLDALAFFIKCPVITKYDEVEGTPDMWKEHTDREGYVIHFLTDNSRVKVKTKEYWQVRFKKDLTPEKILQVYKKGGYDRIKMKLPEEIAITCCDFIDKAFYNWFFDVISTDELNTFIFNNPDGITKDTRKWLFTESGFSQMQLNYLTNLYDKQEMQFHNDKAYREIFYDYAVNNEQLCINLQETVYNIL